MGKEETFEGSAPPHKAARPMKCVKDKSGDLWLCDSVVDTDGDLKGQGCQRAAEMAFDRNF